MRSGSCGSGVSLGNVPPGFELVDNPITELADSPDLPRLRDVFGVTAGDDGVLRIASVTPATSSPHSALHIGPINIALEAACTDSLAAQFGETEFQVETWTVMMVKPGYVGPFAATATVIGSGERVGIQATMVDEGSGGRTMATVSATFRRLVAALG